jgi:hypothetical protein
MMVNREGSAYPIIDWSLSSEGKYGASIVCNPAAHLIVIESNYIEEEYSSSSSSSSISYASSSSSISYASSSSSISNGIPEGVSNGIPEGKEFVLDGFVNGGFEDGTFNGWTQTQGKWFGPDDIYSDTELGITFNDCEIVNSIFTDLRACGTPIGFEGSGNKAARVNDGQSDYHWSKISQTVVDWQEDNIFFSWSVVLEDPINGGHTGNEPGDLGPTFRVLLFNETTQEPLYDIVGSPFGSLPVDGGWKECSSGYGNWVYSGWQHVGLSTSNYVGDTLTLSFTAYNCALGAHGGYVYVDNVGYLKDI